MSTIQIKVANIDLTASVLFATARFMSAVNGVAGDAALRIRDLASSLAIRPGDTLELLIDGEPVWTGWIAQAKRVYAFAAAGTDPTRFWDCVGADINLLFTRRIVFNQSTPEDVLAPLYGPHTADTTAITDLLADWLDLSGDGLDTTTGVVGVGDINEDQNARAWEGSDSWGQAMNSISLLPAAIFYLRPNKELAYVDTDTPDAPFGLSDAPNGTTSKGYREMEILLDGTNLANDVLCWGAGYGSNVPVFVRAEDATSQSDHGLWQLGQVTFGIYKQATIDRVADSILNGSPEHHRGSKDNREAVAITTYEPGLLPAQKVNFESTVFNWSEVLPIRKMEVTFEAPDNPKYVLTLSQEIDTPWSFFDPWRFRFPGFRLPRFPPFPPLPIPEIPGGCTDAVCGITDSFTRSVAEVVHNSNSGSTDADMGLSDSGVAYFNVVNGDQAWLLSNGGIGLSVNGASLVARIFADSGSGVVFGTASGYLRTSVPMDHSAIKSLTFTLSDLPNTGGNASTLVVFIPGGSPSGTKAARVFLNPGSIGATQSYIGFTATSSDSQAIPDAYWQAATVYTVTLQDDGAGTTITVSDGATTYSHTSSGYTGGTLENPALGVSSNTTGGAVTDEYTVTIDNLVIPEITRCSDFLYDSFARTEASSWGNASSGPPWDTYLDGAALGTISVVYGEGVMALGATTSGNAETPAVGPWNTADGFIGTFRFKTDTLGSDIFVDVSELAPGGNFEFTALLDNSTGFVEMASDGDDTVAKTDWATDTWYNVKYEYRPSGVARAKVWEYGTAEPSSWMVSTTAFPDAILNKLGYVGINGSGRSVEIDFAAIGFDYTGKPCYETCECGITDSFNRTVTGGLGASDFGETWDTSGSFGGGSAWDVAAGVATVTAPIAVYRLGLLRLGEKTTNSIRADGQITAHGSPAGGPAFWALAADSSPDFAEIDFDIDGTVSLITVAGTATDTLAFDATSPFKVLLVNDGANARCKVWLATDPEPSGWTLTQAFDTPAPFDVDIYIYVQANATATTGTFANLDAEGINRCSGLAFDDMDRTEATDWGVASSGPTWVGQIVSDADPSHLTTLADSMVPTDGTMQLVNPAGPWNASAEERIAGPGFWSTGDWTISTSISVANTNLNNWFISAGVAGVGWGRTTFGPGTPNLQVFYNGTSNFFPMPTSTFDGAGFVDIELRKTGSTVTAIVAGVQLSVSDFDPLGADDDLVFTIAGLAASSGGAGAQYGPINLVPCAPGLPTPPAPEGPLFGPFCQAATRVDSTHYQLGRAFINLSEQVYVGTPGLLVRPGITLDYTTDPEAGMIVFNDPISDPAERIYVCVTANGVPV